MWTLRTGLEVLMEKGNNSYSNSGKATLFSQVFRLRRETDPASERTTYD
jgi:hypothetical protein